MDYEIIALIVSGCVHLFESLIIFLQNRANAKQTKMNRTLTEQITALSRSPSHTTTSNEE
jgi:hypothetical protein